MDTKILDSIFEDSNRRMDGAVESTHRELVKIRSGKATTAILDGIRVEYYGTKTPLNQIASISVPEPRLLTVQPWDKSIIQEIDKEIRTADLGFNPDNDGTIIRIPIPQLTEERRVELVKLAKKFAEDGHIAVRNVRRDINNQIKQIQKKDDISVDNAHDGLNKIQEMTDEHIRKIDELIELKEKDIMEI